VIVWDLTSRERREKIHPFNHPSHIEWSPRGDLLAVKSTSGNLVLVNLDGDTKEPLWLRKHGREGCEVAFSACGNFLVDGNWDGQLEVFDIRSGEIAYSESITHVMLTSLAYSRSRSHFAYVGSPKATSQTLPSEPDYLSVRKWPFWEHQPVVLPIRLQNIEAIAFSPDEQLLVVAASGPGRESARLQVHNLESGTVIAEAGYNFYASGKSIAWCPRDNVIASVEQGGVRLYDSSLCRSLAFLPVEYPSHVEFSSSGTHLGVGAWGRGFVCLLDEALSNGAQDA